MVLCRSITSLRTARRVSVGESKEGSGISQNTEETGNERRQRVLFGVEEIGFRLAHLAALRRVAVVSIVGDRVRRPDPQGHSESHWRCVR